MSGTLYDWSKLNLHWFPQHMHIGLQKMRHLINRCDVVLEVRDARIPHSSASPQLDSLLRQAKVPLKRYLIFNKTDLAEPQSFRLFPANDKGLECKTFTLSAYDNGAYRNLFREIIGSVKANLLPESNKRFRLLVVGVPNVGKSTLINRFRALGTRTGGKAVAVGNLPGVTRSVSGLVRISEDTPIYIYDTPGILMPRIRDPEVALKLAITGAIPMTMINEYVVVDYLMYTLRKHRNEEGLQRILQDKLGIKETVRDPIHFVEVMSRSHDWKSINVHNAALKFLQAFANGLLGKFTLDTPGAKSLQSKCRLK